jgi:hypothetical protein
VDILLGDTELATVCVVQGLLRARVIKGRLEGQGIPVLLSYESAGPVIGLTVDGLGQVEVRVPASREQEALALLVP